MLLTVVILVATFPGRAQDSTFRYWIPYVDTVHTGNNGIFHYVAIHAFEETSVQIGGNSVLLYAGDSIHVNRPVLKEGLQIKADHQIEIYYYFFPYHWGIYEDGGLQYDVLEERFLGTEYSVPILCTEISILAIKDSTVFYLNDQFYCFNAGQTKRFSGLPIGTEINSNYPISLVAANCTNDHYGSTYALQIYPVSLLGTTYFSPKQHPYTYESSIDSTRIYILAVNDETNITINAETICLNKNESAVRPAIDEVNVFSDKPVYAVYLNDIYGKDPWADIFRHYQIAFQMLSAGTGLTEALIEPTTRASASHGFPYYQVCITSLKDNNKIALISNESTDTITLNYGERSYYHEGDLTPWNTYPLNIKSEDAMHVSCTYRGWWVNIAEATFGREILGRAILLYCNLFAEPEVICQGETSQLQAMPSGGSGNYTYQWSSDPPGFASSLQNPVVAPLVSTVYTVRVSDEYSTTYQSIALEVINSPNLPFEPEIRVCVYDSVILDAGNEGSEYLWSDGSAERIKKVGATGVGFEIQTRTVTVTSPEGCVKTFPCSVVFDFSNCTGIQEQDDEGGFLIYPNPAAGEIVITYFIPVGGQRSAVGGQITLKIYDLHGRMIATLMDEQKQTGEYTMRFDTSNLPAGVYMVRLQAGEERVVRKLLVQ